MTALEFDSYLGLGALIARLEQEDPARILPIGFAEPHSYRGYYHELAFEPRRNISIGDMLAAAKAALGQTFQGYKGGDFTMHEHTDCWIANYGESSDNKIGPLLLELLLAQPPAQIDLGSGQHPAEDSFTPMATLKDSPVPMYPEGEDDIPPNAGSAS